MGKGSGNTGMTIIFQGKNFWIEQILQTLSIGDAAGFTNGADIILERAGSVLSVSTAISGLGNNDNTQAISVCPVTFNAAGVNFSFGLFIDRIATRCLKQAGTAGATPVNIIVTLFMRKTGPISV